MKQSETQQQFNNRKEKKEEVGYKQREITLPCGHILITSNLCGGCLNPTDTQILIGPTQQALTSTLRCQLNPT